MRGVNGGRDRQVQFHSWDGTGLHGTLRTVQEPSAGVLLVHGLTGDRDENGLYVDLAARLARSGMRSLRFDIRGHGRTGGRYEDVTMSGVVGDIGAAYGQLAQGLPRGAPALVVGMSFGGAMSVCWAAATSVKSAGEPAKGRHTRVTADPMVRAAPLAGIVLLCPLFDCRKRFLTDRPYWSGTGLSDEAAAGLAYRGWLEHAGGFRIGRAMYNELSIVRPQDRIADVDIPVLTIHGDVDAVAPYDTSRAYAAKAKDSEFVAVRGADHGFVHPDDESCRHPDTRRLRDEALAKAVSWISARA